MNRGGQRRRTSSTRPVDGVDTVNSQQRLAVRAAEENSSRFVPQPPPPPSVKSSLVGKPFVAARGSTRTSVRVSQDSTRRQSSLHIPRRGMGLGRDRNTNGSNGAESTEAEGEGAGERKQNDWKDSLRADVFGSVWSEVNIQASEGTREGSEGANLLSKLQWVDFSACDGDHFEKIVKDSCVRSENGMDAFISTISNDTIEATNQTPRNVDAIKTEVEGVLDSFHRNTVTRVAGALGGNSLVPLKTQKSSASNASLFPAEVHAEAYEILQQELEIFASTSPSNEHRRRRSDSTQELTSSLDWNHMYQSALEDFFEALASEHVEKRNGESVSTNVSTVEEQRQTLLSVIAAFIDRSMETSRELVETLLDPSNANRSESQRESFTPLPSKERFHTGDESVVKSDEKEEQTRHWYRGGIVYYLATPPFETSTSETKTVESSPTAKKKGKLSEIEDIQRKSNYQEQMERQATRYFRLNQILRNAIIEYNCDVLGARENASKEKRHFSSLSEYLFLTLPLVACCRAHGYLVVASTVIPAIPQSFSLNTATFVVKQRRLLERALILKGEKCEGGNGPTAASQTLESLDGTEEKVRDSFRPVIGQDSRLYVASMSAFESQLLPLPYSTHPLCLRSELGNTMLRVLPVHQNHRNSTETCRGSLTAKAVRLHAASCLENVAIQRCADVMSMMSPFTEVEDADEDPNGEGNKVNQGGNHVCPWCGEHISTSELSFSVCHCPTDCCRLCANCYGTLLIRQNAAEGQSASSEAPAMNEIESIQKYLQRIVGVKCQSGARTLNAARMIPDVATIVHLYGVNLSFLGHVHLRLHPASRFVTAKYVEVEMISRAAARQFFALLRHELEIAARCNLLRTTQNNDNKDKERGAGKLIGRGANWRGTTLIKDVCQHTSQVFLSKFLGGGSSSVLNDTANEPIDSASTSPSDERNVARRSISSSKPSKAAPPPPPPALDAALSYWAMELGPSVEASYFSPSSDAALNSSLLMNPLSTESLSIELLWQRFAELVGITMSDASKKSFIPDDFFDASEGSTTQAASSAPFLSVLSISTVAKLTTLPQLLLMERTAQPSNSDHLTGEKKTTNMDSDQQSIQQACSNYGEYLLFWIAFQSSNPNCLDEKNKSVYLHE